MRHHAHFSTFALICICFVGSGCTTKIPIRSNRPGPVAVGATNHLVMVKGLGRRSAREEVAQQVINQCRRSGYFSVQDRTEEPIFVQVAGGQVQIEGDPEAFSAPLVAGLKIDVLDLDYERDVQIVEFHDEQTGTIVYEHYPIQRGIALLAVTLFDPIGRTYLAEREYERAFTTNDLGAHREDVTSEALAHAVSAFLQDITPRQVVTRVRLDEDDEGQIDIIATAKAGSIGLAAKDAQVYAEANPGNPAAAYNLAVFLDAMGQYEEALTWYDKAMRNGSKSYYARARSQCARRHADAQALQAKPIR